MTDEYFYVDGYKNDANLTMYGGTWNDEKGEWKFLAEDRNVVLGYLNSQYYYSDDDSVETSEHEGLLVSVPRKYHRASSFRDENSTDEEI